MAKKPVPKEPDRVYLRKIALAFQDMTYSDLTQLERTISEHLVDAGLLRWDGQHVAVLF